MIEQDIMLALKRWQPEGERIYAYLDEAPNAPRSIPYWVHQTLNEGRATSLDGCEAGQVRGYQFELTLYAEKAVDALRTAKQLVDEWHDRSHHWESNIVQLMKLVGKTSGKEPVSGRFSQHLTFIANYQPKL